MTYWTLIRRSLSYHARAHLGTLLGAAVGSAVLVGALVVGDSVRESLRQFALARLGKTDLALMSNDRFFRLALADSLQTNLDNLVAPGIQLLATATASDAATRANRVQLIGADERFWNLANQYPAFQPPAADEVILNERLAEQLKVKAGGTVLLRVPKPSQLSREAPVSPQENSSVPLRVTVRAIASDAEFGRFSLQANQAAPLNAFVSLPWLQERLQVPGRANLILAVGNREALDAYLANVAVRQTWQLADAELELRELPDHSAIELRTGRIFLDPIVAEAARHVSSNAAGLLTYFVNELRIGERSTPYSMVTAMGSPVVPQGMGDDEILINQWLADDLKANPGDELTLTYFVVGTMRKLEERSSRFRIRSIVPMTGASADRELMPDFPGMANAKDCRDWDTGFPIQLDRIRSQDNQYWQDYRGTPKAFVTVAAGQHMWSNRFGNLTAVRFPASEGPIEKLTEALRQRLDPAAFGLNFQPVRAQALKASAEALDFGQLFLGFSFFLIIAALLLMSLLFQLGVERRATEVGTLLALGFQPKQVRRLFWLEGCALAALGGLLGMAGGLAYSRAMIYGLSTIWRNAVAKSSLQFHAELSTLLGGSLAGAVVAGFTIWLALRKQARQPAHELLAEGSEEGGRRIEDRGWKSGRGVWVAFAACAGAGVLIGWALWHKDSAAAGAFFGAGALMLIGGLGFCSALIGSLGRASVAARLTVSSMGVRNVTRRRKRSLATLALLACGSFLVVAVGANRLDANREAGKRSSGTGGFAWMGETSAPVVHDLDSRAGREFFGLESSALTGVHFVPLRVRDGDDASCLNLNRAQTPRLLGVRPELLADRGAFKFAGVIKGSPPGNPWMLLNSPAGRASVRASADSTQSSKAAQETAPRQDAPEDEVVPAIGDEASIQWALGRKLGDTLDYTDERGRPFKVRLVGALANSILQGSLVISEQQFIARFPNESGYRMFLIDAPSNRVSQVSSILSRALEDQGLELTPAAQRLADLNAVQNTYLSTFQVLGGLGLLLGSAGLGVVVLRNVMERRGELALLLAVGFRRRALKWLLLSEHAALLMMGLAVGVIAAMVAVLPALMSPGAEAPYRSLTWTLLAVLANGFLWTWSATMMALRGRILEALRNE